MQNSLGSASGARDELAENTAKNLEDASSDNINTSGESVENETDDGDEMLINEGEDLQKKKDTPINTQPLSPSKIVTNEVPSNKNKKPQPNYPLSGTQQNKGSKHPTSNQRQEVKQKSNKFQNAKPQQQENDFNDLEQENLADTYEDVLQDPSQIPTDAKFVSLLLKSEGVSDFDPNVIPQLLEFMYKYTFDVLKDAQVYAEYAKHKDITLSDVRMSVESRISHSFILPPTRETNMRLVEEINSKPIPIIPYIFGVVLPPEKYTLSGSNFQISVGETKIKTKYSSKTVGLGSHQEAPPTQGLSNLKDYPIEDRDDNASDTNELVLTLDPPAKKVNDASDDDYDSFI